MKKGIALLFMITALLLVHPAFAADPTEPHNADAMWIEPSVIDITGVSIGYRFNVTVWINLTVISAGWQFRMLYFNDLLNATRIGYTAGSKSDFFQNLTTMPVTPQFVVMNDTYSYALHGESWLFGDYRSPGYGSLSWVEFEVMAAPPFTCELDISSDHHPPTSKTYALTPTLAEIPLNVYDNTIYPEYPSLLAIVLLNLAFLVALVAAKKKK